MLKSILLVVVAGFTLHYFLLYRDWLHWHKNTVLKVRPGPCHTVQERLNHTRLDDNFNRIAPSSAYNMDEMCYRKDGNCENGGSEDIVHIGDGIFLMSTGFEFDKPTGDIIGLDVNEDRMFTINKTDLPESQDPILASAHGITTWKDPQSGRLYLYVLTHPPSKDIIRVFEVLKPLELRYIKTITDPSFTYMNDLVAVDLDKFYITKYAMYRGKFSIQLEHIFHLRQGSIYYYDGRKASLASSGYFMPNGINISPDKSMIYMAEWGGQRLFGFKRDSTNNLLKLWDVDMGTGVDNIDVDEHGDLWIGCHPITWKILDFYNLFGVVAPSQVLRVKIRGHDVSEIEEIYADDGYECSGSTIANYAHGKLVVGTVARQTVVCDVKYLST